MVGLDSAGKTTILYRLQVSLSTTLCRKRAEIRLEKLFLLFQVCPPTQMELDIGKGRMS
jgi:GTPase SAR1 family protein